VTRSLPRLVAIAVLLGSFPAAPPAAFAGGLAAAAAGVEDRHGEALRRHPLRTIQGRSLTLADLQGEVVVVNFWASWCRPCRRELPGLEALHRDLARGAGGARGRVVAISIDAEAANAVRFLKDHGLSLPACHDGPDGLARTLDLDRVPTTLVLDRDGRIAFVQSGGGAQALGELTAVTRRLLATRRVTDLERGTAAAAEPTPSTEDRP
jgi:thiol-disulfide isomerase/thioredoxin